MTIKSKYSNITLDVFVFLTSCILCLIVIEIVLQFFPVRSYIPYTSVDTQNPIIHYQPHQKFIHSHHWHFQDVNHGHTNAQGYISNFDYDANATSPLIAVIGDSYVEARMVPFKDTIQEQIRTGLKNKSRVYGFGMGGAPLSQYLAMAKYVRENYKPDFMVINIVSNDFNESFTAYRNIPRFHYFIKVGLESKLSPQLIGEYRPSWIKEVISNSALVRYVYFHLNISNMVNNFLFNWRQTKDDIAVNASSERDALSRQAVDAFLTLLPEYAGLPKNKILLVIDGIRTDIYQKETTGTSDPYFASMRQYTITHARQNGFEIVDLNPVFQKDYAAHSKKFNFEYDAHWNAHGHHVAADAVLKSKSLNAAFLSPK